jgi:uncharacterized phage-like protein YoqJ
MIIAVTGHRPDKLGWGYELSSKIPEYNKLYQIMYNFLLETRPIKCISGMALGVDTLFACAVLKYKEKYSTLLECAIPCINHSSKWQEKDINLYNKILLLADIVTYVSKREYQPWLMQERNEYMVDNCDMLLGIWNGSSGGTANCIKYAKSKNKTIKIINPNNI